MANQYDVIVVGAGPAGACAGYESASAGLKTLILERRSLPRYKTCGGGVPLTVAHDLPHLFPEAFVEATVTHLRHTWDFGDAHLAALNPDPQEPSMSLWMVQRSIFDNALTERAARAGCDVRDGLAVKSVMSDGEKSVRVTTADGDVYHASHVVGADGANGIVARMAGLRKSRLLAIALEAEIPHEWGLGHEALRPEVAHLEYGVKQGYAWMFPKAGHLSVGAGMFGRRSAEGKGEAGKDELARWILGYLNSLGVPKRREEITFHGHPLPIWGGSEPVEAWGGAFYSQATRRAWSTLCLATAFPMPAGRVHWRAGRWRGTKPGIGRKHCGRNWGQAMTPRSPLLNSFISFRKFATNWASSTHADTDCRPSDRRPSAL